MPNVSIDLSELSGVTPGTDNLKNASVWFYPYRPYEDGGSLVTTDKLVVSLTLGVGSTFLPETPDANGMWVEIRNVRLPSDSRKFVVAIPGTDCNLFGLDHLDPDSLDHTAPLSPAWVADLAAAVALLEPKADLDDDTGALVADPTSATAVAVAAKIAAGITGKADSAAVTAGYGNGALLPASLVSVATAATTRVFGSMGGVLYGSDIAGTGLLSQSTDDGTTWTPIHTFPTYGVPIGIGQMGNGEVFVVCPGGAWRSTGWAANPITATWTLAAQPTGALGGFAAASFVASTWDVYDNVVVLGEYVNPKNNSNMLQVSTDYGVTFSTKFSLHTQYPGQEANTHYHAVAVDPWTVVAGGYRIWFTHGDGPRGVFYSDNLGVAWTQFTGGTSPDMDLTASNLMTVAATPAGMVFTTDSNAPDGVYKVERSGTYAGVLKRMLKIPYPYSAASLLGFGSRAWRDPLTNLVWMTYNVTTPAAAGSPALPGYVFVSDGKRASIAWTTPETAASGQTIYPDGIGITSSGALIVGYKLTDGTTYKQAKLTPGGRGGNSNGDLDRGNALTGYSSSREAVAIGPNTTSKGDSVAIGANVTLTDTSGVVPQAVVVGNNSNGGTQSVVIGNAASGPWTSAVVVGYLAAVTDIDAVAIGKAASSSTNSSAVGSGAIASTNSVAVGKGALANPTSGGSAVAIGQGATVGTTGSGAIAIGKSASATGANSVSVGGTASATQSVAIGPFTAATVNTGAVAIGTSAAASGQYAVALGKSATATHNGSVALGDSSATTATQQIATGLHHFEMKEVTAPAAGGVDTGRVFLQDNGAGKTQLCVIFNTGAVQVIASQP